VYDGSDIIARVGVTGNFIEYVLPGCNGIDINGQPIYQENNPLGSTVTLCDPVGKVLSQTEFNAFGIETQISGTYTQPWSWGATHGYFRDGQSQLELCGARYFIPALGRWLTQDPREPSAGVNLYEYCKDNPLAKWDPSGHALGRS
jgi:RHS repeat-associated protein